MKLVTLLVCVLILSTQLFSQQYTNSNMPVLGDSVAIRTNNDLTVFEPGEGGENVTWDFTTIKYGGEDYFNFVSPASTPFGDEFSDAVMCGVSSGESYQYYSSIMDKMEISGFGSSLDPNSNILAFFDPPINQFNLPLSFGTKQSSTYKGKYVFGGNEFPLTGTVTTEVDGKGTLITGAGTFDNVLRIHVKIAETGLAAQQVDKYLYVSEDYKFWLALHEEVSALGDINIQKWYAVNPLKISQASVSIDTEMKTLQVFPNPTDDMITINSVNSVETIQLFDVMGKMVASINLNGVTRHQMNVSGLNTGVYNVVTSSNGELTTTKFIKK
ncbi:MAG: T9SS type A sorting domain-containing protein [Candidatus Kapaibacterium sp.]